jgi:hypothetical protein
MNGKYYGQREIRWHSREKDRLEHIQRKDKDESIRGNCLIWGIVLALVLATFLLNFWLVHHIKILIGAKATGTLSESAL